MILPSLSDVLDRYDFRAENLWVVFTAASDTLRRMGQPPILQGFYLSDAGEAGRQAILRIEQGCGGFLGCFDLPSLRQALALIDDQPVLDAGKGRGWLAGLLAPRTFLLPTSLQGALRFIRVRARTLEQAMDTARQAHPEAVLGFGGVAEDLQALVSEMERVLEEKDWRALSRDRRGRMETWDADRLLLAKRAPHLVPGMDPDTEQLTLSEA